MDEALFLSIEKLLLDMGLNISKEDKQFNVITFLNELTSIWSEHEEKEESLFLLHDKQNHLPIEKMITAQHEQLGTLGGSMRSNRNKKQRTTKNSNGYR